MTRRLTEVELPRNVRLPDRMVPAIPDPETLAQPLRARGERMELSSRRVRVVLSSTEGILWMEGDGTPLLANLMVDELTAANLLVSPRSARRECFREGRGILESLQLPEALPGAVIQWRWTSGGPPTMESLPLRFHVLPDQTAEGTADLLFHREPGLLWVGQGGSGVLLAAPGSLALPLIRRQDASLLVEWDLPRDEVADTPVTLLIQAAPPDGTWTQMPALAQVAAHHRRGETAAGGEEDPGLELATGVEEVDQGMRWSRAWMRDRLLAVPKRPASVHPVELTEVPGGGPSPWLVRDAGPAWFAMAAAATGDWEAARGALDRLRWGTPAAAVPSALALARWVAWSGDGSALGTAEDELLQALGEAGSLSGSPDVPGPVMDAVRAEVGAAGEAVEHPGLASLASLPPSPTTRMRLPTVGGGSSMEVDPILFPADPRHGIGRRMAMARGAREALGTITRSAPSLRSGHGIAAALLWSYGVLGARPDATFSRITLSPLFLPHWTTARVLGVRTGEGTVDLSYQREGAVARWEITPRQGSLPLMVVLEPWQPVHGVREVRVDGEPAELDLTEREGWSRVRVQIPADGPRTVEIRGEGVTPPPE